MALPKKKDFAQTIFSFLGNNRDLLLVILACFLAFESYLLSHRGKDKSTQPLVINLGSRLHSAPTFQPTASPLPTSEHSPLLEILRSPKSYSLVQMAHPDIIDGNLNLSFHVVWRNKKSLLLADVENELARSPGKQIVVSLESLDSDISTKPAPEAKIVVPSSAFFQDHYFSLQLQVPKEAAQYGLFICTTTNADSACSDKELAKIGKYSRASKNGRTIFFAYIIFVDGAFLTPDYKLQNTGYESIERVAMDILSTKPSAKIATNEQKTSRAQNIALTIKTLTETLPAWGIKSRPTVNNIELN